MARGKTTGQVGWADDHLAICRCAHTVVAHQGLQQDLLLRHGPMSNMPLQAHLLECLHIAGVALAEAAATHGGSDGCCGGLDKGCCAQAIHKP
jgi:hypothetical protein